MTLTTYTTDPKSDATAIARYIQGLRELGWTPTGVFDGGEAIPLQKSDTVTDIVSYLTATDMSVLYLKKGKQRVHMVIVLGNEPHEVANDCTYVDGWNEDIKAVEDAIFPEQRL